VSPSHVAADAAILALMSRENVERVEQVFGWTYTVETWPTPVLREIFHPDLAYHPRAEDPETDTQFGRDAWEAILSDYIEALSEITFDIVELIDAGDRVIASTVLHGRGNVSGVEVSDPYVHVYRFRDGVVVEIWEYRTLPEAVEAHGAGSSETP
jgi:ketosteroid isomerase-like protein